VRRRGVIPLALAAPEQQDRCSFSLGERADVESCGGLVLFR
jgi:hypothetical protein